MVDIWKTLIRLVLGAFKDGTGIMVFAFQCLVGVDDSTRAETLTLQGLKQPSLVLSGITQVLAVFALSAPLGIDDST